MLQRVLENLIGRIHGPFAFRFVLQPLVAIVVGLRAGVKDARAGRPAYGYSLFFHRGHRREILREGFRDIVRIFIVAILMDVIYQVVVLRWIYPGEALIVASVLAFVPYVLIRGPMGRLAHRWYRKRRQKMPMVPS